MFLKYYKPSTNSLRNKIKIISFLSNLKTHIKVNKKSLKQKITSNHKFLTNSRSVFNLNLTKQIFLGSHIIFKWIKINYSNIFLNFCYFADNTILIKPAFYGFSFNKYYHNYFLSPFIYKRKYENSKRVLNVSTYNFIIFHDHNSIFFFLKDFFSKKFFAKSAGTFCRVLNFDKTKHTFFIKLPSSKRMYFDFYVIGFLGRSSNIFCKYQFFSSFKQKLLFKKHKPKVRGVAKNPVDHPNGGSSKVKKPLKTPWGKIAKKNK